MTAPLAPSPSIQLGNTASDIGSGTNSFVQGLIGQRVRQQQIAMQQAMASSRQQLEQGQLQDIQAQAAQRQHENEPAGDAEFSLLNQAYPHVPMQQWQTSGITRGDAHDLAKTGLIMQRMGMTMNRFDENAMLNEINRFKGDPEVKNATGVGAAYRNMQTLLKNPTPAAQPSLLLEFGQMLGMPGQPNARAIGTELNALLRGGSLTYSQELQRFLNKVDTEGDQFTFDPQTLQNLPRIVHDVAQSRINRYDALRGDLKNRTRSILGTAVPDDAIGQDPFGDIRNEIYGVSKPGVTANPNAPGTGGSGIRLPGVDQ